MTNDNTISIIGTSRQGTIEATYDQLVAAFGRPNAYATGKVSLEWRIQFPDATIATVYDYKADQGRFSSDEIRSWSIGGLSADAVQGVNWCLFASHRDESWLRR